MHEEDVPVLVVGGSLVGLSTSLFLASHGVPSLVVERHHGTAIHPRAAFILQRTIETYRSVGLEKAISVAAAQEFIQNGAIMSVESLGGREIEWYFRNINDGVEDLSPSRRLFFTQIGLEPILRHRAEELGARVQYASEVVSIEADAGGITAVVQDRDSGEQRRVHARYVVAADGARSPVRERLGISMCGHGTFSNSITIYFRADVRELIGDRVLSVVYVFHPELQGFFRFSIDGDAGFLVVNTTVDANGQRSRNVAEDASNERCIEYVRLALGASDLPVEIEAVQHWSSIADWAERFQEGRVLLVGDAAHVMPPTGGYGGNTGIHDAHNLAWKLALVLDSVAGPDLLATYDAERRPVASFTVEQAYTRYVLRLDPELDNANLVPIVDDATIDLGYRYRSTAVVGKPDDDDGADREDPHKPSGRPGFRAPHVVVERDGTPLSTLDLMGKGFVLFAGADAESWCRAGRAAGQRLGVQLDAYTVGESSELAERSGRFAEAYGTGTQGATLVRPDGFIAWRSRSADRDDEQVLTDVLAQVLSRSLPAQAS